MSLRDDILQADDLQREAVEVPEWGVTVHVRELPGVDMQGWAMEMDRLQEEITSGDLEVDWRAKLLVKSLVDENGDRIFDDDDVEDLSRRANSVIDRLADETMRVNGFEPDDIEAAVAGN